MAPYRPGLGLSLCLFTLVFVAHSHKIRHKGDEALQLNDRALKNEKDTFSIERKKDSESIERHSQSSNLFDNDNDEGVSSSERLKDDFQSADLNGEGGTTQRSPTGTMKPTFPNYVDYSTTTKSVCPSCEDFETAQAFVIETIKAKILKKLQLTTVPKVDGRTLPKIPHLQRIIDKYNLQSDMPYLQDRWARRDNYYDNPEELARTEKIFALGTPLPDYLSHINSTKACHFVLDVGNNMVKRGTLWIYLRPSKDHQSTVTYLKVFKLGPPRKPGAGPMRTLVRNKKILLERIGGWHHFDLFSIINRWVMDPHSNYGLEVEALDDKEQNLVVIPPGLGPDAGYEPFLAIRVTPPFHHRSRRETQSVCRKERRFCCRRYLMLDFESFGWDFIISPKRFIPYYCSGLCPPLYLEEHQGTHLLRMNTSYEVCCKPSSLGPLQMLYVKNDSNYAVGYIPGMITKTCSCA